MGKKNSLYHSVMENALRLGLLLGEIPGPRGRSWLSVVDFMTVHGDAFGLRSQGLHGENPYGLLSFPLWEEQVREALCLLVAAQDAWVYGDGDDLHYTLSPTGRQHMRMLTAPYAQAYREVAAGLIPQIHGVSEEALLCRVLAAVAASPAAGGIEGVSP